MNLVSLKNNFHLKLHEDTLRRSVWRLSMSSSELMIFKHLVSSAYRNGVEWTVDRGRSLMKIPNNNGPNMLPCGTPDSTAQ